MKAVVDTETFAEAVRAAKRIVPASKVRTIYQDIGLAVEGDRLRVSSAQFAQASFSRWIPAEAAEEGAIVVPSAVLSDLVDLLPGEQTELDVQKKPLALVVRSGFTRASIRSADAYFPALPDGDKGRLVYDAQELRRALIAVRVAAQRGEQALFTCSILWDHKGEFTRLAATDGNWMGVCDVKPKQAEAEPFSLLIHVRLVDALVSLLGTEDVLALPGDKTLTFRTEDSVLTVASWPGSFPKEYEKILLVEPEAEAVVSRADLIRAIKPAAALDYSRVLVQIADSELAIQAGEMYTASMDVQMRKGQVETALNASYVLRGLSGMGNEAVAVRLSRGAPCALWPHSGSGPVYVIMPMKA